MRRARDNGVLLRHQGKSIMVIPPLTLTYDEMVQFADVTVESLSISDNARVG